MPRNRGSLTSKQTHPSYATKEKRKGKRRKHRRGNGKPKRVRCFIGQTGSTKFKSTRGPEKKKGKEAVTRESRLSKKTPKKGERMKKGGGNMERLGHTEG